ncbi:MAG: GNAT family N-acetyltransferase [Gammaproteobacteria bacterium]|nr:GNAT family N-acetyltransferase [Gammaproteobacteria bacterium]
MATTVIRLGDARDKSTLVAFNQAMALQTEGLELPAAVVTAGVTKILENPQHGFYLIAQCGTEVAGSLMVTNEWSDWRNGNFWWIQSVYVRPEYRRQGIYRQLYQHMKILAADSEDICGFRLYVERDNRVAQETYQALGMRPTHYQMYEEIIE